MTEPRVGRAALLLGFAGLLPQMIAVAVIAAGSGDWPGYAVAVAIGYASAILSFLGGMWWGCAMRRTHRQATLAALAVLPSLIVLAVVLALIAPQRLGIAYEVASAGALIVLGLAILLTIPIEMRLESTGDGPVGWTRFRTALSIGLGLLTIAAGLLGEHAYETVTHI